MVQTSAEDRFQELYGSTIPIAVIGAGCRFARSPEIFEFFRRLADGEELIDTFDAARLAAAGVDPKLLERPDYVPRGGVLEDADRFDWEFFGYSRLEAESIDPQHRIFLSCAWEALEMAGYRPGESSLRVGVVGACKFSTYRSARAHDIHDVANPTTFQKLVGNDKDYIASRVSYKLKLTGPSFTIQTACSSSLVAIHLACEQLASGECDMALAGGVGVAFPQESGYFYREGMIFSPDGRCRAFDCRAQGTTIGNGAAVVLLKPLDRALADGDPILCVIRGSAVNNDGGLKAGYTAPSVEGQRQVISDALGLAAVNPSTIDLVEAHGTATPLGDPIEVAALTDVYRSATDERGYCAIGSVKSNLGHLDTAAGVASFLKAALAVHAGQIPPSLHFETPNPALELDTTPFYVPQTLLSWPERSPRRAAVSSFGIGGTNAHVILEQAPDEGQKAPAAQVETGPLLLSARSTASLRELARRHALRLSEGGMNRVLAEYCATSVHCRSLFPYRLVVVGGTAEELSELLFEFAEENDVHVQRVEAEAGLVLKLSALRLDSPESKKIAEVLRSQAADPKALCPPPRRRQLLPTAPFEGRPCFTLEAVARPSPAVCSAWSALVQKGAAAASDLGASLDLSHLAEEARAVDALHAIYVSKALLDLGLFTDDKRFSSLEELSAEAGIPDRYTALFERLLRDLSAEGVIECKNDAPVTLYGGLRAPELGGAARWLELMRSHAYGHLAALIERTGPRLAEMLTGRLDPVSVVFPDAETEDLELMYRSQANSAYLNGVLARTLAGWARASGRPLRVLEVGAGTGSTTHDVLAALGPGQCERYTFTDVGPLFVQRARRTFAHCPFFHYAVFDMERAPLEQGLQREEYDVIVAANVLHNASELRAVLRRLGSLLKPGGILLMREVTEPKKLFDFVFGPLVPKIADADARGGELFASVQQWGDALTDAGFERYEGFPSAHLPSHRLGEHVIAARWPGELALGRPVPANASATLHWEKTPGRNGTLVWDAGQLVKIALSQLSESSRVVLEDLCFHAQPEENESGLSLIVTHSERDVRVSAETPAGTRSLMSARVSRPRCLPQRRKERTAGTGARGSTHSPLDPGASGSLLAAALRHGAPGNGDLWPHRISWLHWPGPLAPVDPALAEEATQERWITDESGRVLLCFGEVTRGAPLPVPSIAQGALYCRTWRQASLPLAKPPSRVAWITGESGVRVPEGPGIEHYVCSPDADARAALTEWLRSREPELVCYVVPDPGRESGCDLDVQRRWLEPLLSIVSALAALPVPSRLAVLTRHTIVCDGDDTAPGYGAQSLLGVLAVARQEYPELATLFLDRGEQDDVASIQAAWSGLSSHEAGAVLRGEQSSVARLVPADLPAQRSLAAGRHLLVGGLSTLGLALARWLVESGAREITILARREPTTDERELLHALTTQGAEIELDPRVDVTDPNALARALDRLVQRNTPIAGVYHLAGVVRDAPLSRLLEHWDDVDVVLRTKLVPARVLDDWEPRLRPAYTVYFSSAATVLGPKGQAAHAAANAALEGLAEHRSRRGHDTVALAWGFWAETGATKRAELSDQLAERGMLGLETKQGLGLLGAALAGSTAVYAPLRLDWEALVAQGSRKSVQQPLFAELAPLVRDVDPSPSPESQRLDAWVTELRSGDPSVLAEASRRYLRARVAQLLRCDEAKVVGDANLVQLGLDSLVFLELGALIEQDLGVRISAETALRAGTLAGFAEGLVDALTPASVLRPNSALGQALAELEQREGGWVSPNGDLLPRPGPESDPFPLTGLSYARWLDRSDVPHHLYVEYDLPQDFDIAAFERAWNQVVARHDLLRATIDDYARVRILPAAPHYSIVEMDLRELSEERRAAEQLALREAMSQKALDLRRWPHFDLRVSRSPDGLRLHLDLDVTLVDIESFQVVLRELHGLVREPTRKLPTLALSGRDYAITERMLRETSAYAEQLHAHGAHLTNVALPPRLPLVCDPAELPPARFRCLREALPRSAWSALKERAAAANLRGTSVVLAAYGLALSQWAGRRTFCLRLDYLDRKPIHAHALNVVLNASQATPIALPLDKAPSLLEVARASHADIAARLSLDLLDSTDVLTAYHNAAKIAGGSGQGLPVAFASLLGVREDYAMPEVSDPLLGMPSYEYAAEPGTWLRLQALEEESELRLQLDVRDGIFPEDLADTVLLDVTRVLEMLSRVPAAFTAPLEELLPPDPEIDELLQSLSSHSRSLPAEQHP